MYVENNNRHHRGKKRAIDTIVRYVLPVIGFSVSVWLRHLDDCALLEATLLEGGK
jgi:hypothetical protein